MKSKKAVLLSTVLALTVTTTIIVPTQSAFAQEKTPTVVAAKAEPIAFSRILKQGMYGKDVFQLQTLLASLNYYSGYNSGIFGPRTTQAVNAFKKKHNLPVNGIIDAATIASLDTQSLLDIVFITEKKAKTAVVETPASKIVSPQARSIPKAEPQQVADVAPMMAMLESTTASNQEVSLSTGSLQSPTFDIAPPECFVSAVDAVIECNSAATSGFIEFIQKPQNKKAVIKIAGSELSKTSRISIKPIIEGKPSKWMLNIGNSKFNDGWGGGLPQDPYNAEIQIIDGILGVFKGDNKDKATSASKTLFARDIKDTLEDTEIVIQEGSVEIIPNDTTSKPTLIKDKNLFVFDTGNEIHNDIYIGLNRTIYDEDRGGSGIKGVMITLTEVDSTTQQ